MHYFPDWWTLERAALFAKFAALALGLFSVAGFFAGLWRIRSALRLDLLLAWIVLAAGTTVAQSPVYIGGMTGWGVDLVTLSGAGRALQCLGVVLFVRGVFRGVCSDWGWRAIAVFVLGLAALLTSRL